MSVFPSKVLLATDGSPDAGLAARAAVDLCRGTGAELHVVHAWQVLPPVAHAGSTLGYHASAYEEEAAELLEEQVTLLRVPVAGKHLREGRPAEEIADLAQELGADLVVVGSRGLGTVERLATGSVSEGVARLAPCPVLVTRGSWPPHEVIIGDDSSDESRDAGEVAARLARLYGASVLLLRAYHPQQVLKTVRAVSHDPGAADAHLEAGEEQLRERASELGGVLRKSPKVKAVAGDAASTIQREVGDRHGGTLVVVGSRGQGAVRRFALGSVSTDVLRAVDGPVLVCPLPEYPRGTNSGVRGDQGY